MGKILKFLLKVVLWLLLLGMATALIEQFGGVLIAIVVIGAVVAVIRKKPSDKSSQPPPPKSAEDDKIEKLHVDMED